MSMSQPSAAAAAAAVELFSTSILSNHKIRSRHERYISIFSVKKIPYVYHDLASDEEAKSRWRRKARDPQIPGVLVHNEWRGTFEEFEEAVEFGEVELFLKIDEERVQKDAAAGLAPAIPQIASSSDLSSASGQDITSAGSSSTAPARPSRHVTRLAQPRAPSQNTLTPALPFAPSGSGRRKEHDADSFLTSLGITDINLTEDELNEILEAGKSTKETPKEADNPAEIKSSEKGSGRYPNGLGLGTTKPAVQRTYIPSAEAGVKPLRLARMADGNKRSESSSSTLPLQTSPSARYSASQLSSKALAAEAQASISSRSFSSVKLREAVSKGNKLDEAFRETRVASNADVKENVVGREDLDDLMASLGLNDVKMTDEEADAFLLDGIIPSGLDSYGPRLGRSGSTADRARNEAAARDVARRAKEKGYGTDSSRPESLASSNGGLEAIADASSPGVNDSAEESESEKEISVFDETEPTKKDDSLVAAAAKIGNGLPKTDEVLSSASVEAESLPQTASEPFKDMTPRQTSTELPLTLSEDIVEKKVALPGTSQQEEVEPLSQEESAEDRVEELKPTEDKSDGIVLSPGMAQESNNKAEDISDVRDADDVSVELSDATKEAPTNGNISFVADLPTSSASKDDFRAPEVPSKTSDVLKAAEGTKVRPTTLLIDQEFLSSLSFGEDGPANKETGAVTQEEGTSFPELSFNPTVSSPTSPVARESIASESASAASTGESKITSPRQSSTTPKTLSPVNTRRSHNESPSLTPSRRAMDLPRKMPSINSLSDMGSPSARSHASSAISSPPPLEGLKLSDNLKSPKSASKKFFSLGRRKNQRSSSSSKKADGSDSDAEDLTTTTAMSPSSSDSRNQKTLSMILREADEALNGADSDGEGQNLSMDGDDGGSNAFDLELDDLDEDPDEGIKGKA